MNADKPSDEDIGMIVADVIGIMFKERISNPSLAVMTLLARRKDMYYGRAGEIAKLAETRVNELLDRKPEIARELGLRPKKPSPPRSLPPLDRSITMRILGEKE